MLKRYRYKGLTFQWEEGKAPEGAVELEAEERKAPEAKEKPAPRNKARSAANKKG